MIKKTMNDFIIESADIGLENLQFRKQLTKVLVDEYCNNGYKDICLIASGSSGNACHMARLFIQNILHCRVDVISPFTFEYHDHVVKDTTMLVVVSQSGYSTNAISALEKIKKLGKKTIGMSGDIESDLKNYCDLLVDYKVGVETVGYVTKGVVTLCAFWMLFALESALIKKIISDDVYTMYCKEIALAFTCHKEIYEAVKSFYDANQKDLLSMQHIYVCSNGANLGVAMEGALKIGETVQIPSFAYEIEEYIHGPNLQLTPNYPIFFIDNNDETSERIGQIYDATCMVSDKVFMISNHRKGKRIISIPNETSSLVSPLYNVVVFQYLAYRITEDLHKWKKHPLFEKFEQAVQCKSENYKNSALASED